ncbi:MAG: hypothetical protein H8E98_08245 [Bacteroidetes bacterium]|nr:hypothetical protein [Bacteroidota bacterium]
MEKQNKPKQCRSCKNPILYGATVCHHCGSSQYKVLNFINKISSVAVLVSIVLLGLSIAQYLDSRKNIIETKEALRIAEESKAYTIKLKFEIDSIKNEIDSTTKYFKNSILLSTQNAWINVNEPMLGFNVDRPIVKKYEKNTANLISMVLKDSAEIKKWWRETDSIVNPQKYK